MANDYSASSFASGAAQAQSCDFSRREGCQAATGNMLGRCSPACLFWKGGYYLLQEVHERALLVIGVTRDQQRQQQRQQQAVFQLICKYDPLRYETDATCTRSSLRDTLKFNFRFTHQTDEQTASGDYYATNEKQHRSKCYLKGRPPRWASQGRRQCCGRRQPLLLRAAPPPPPDRG